MFNTLFYIFLAPVFIGTSMAFGDGLANIPVGIGIGFLASIAYLLHKFLFANKFKKNIPIEFLVFLLFGPIGVGLTYYIQSNEINAAVINAGFAIGLIAICLRSLRTKEGFIFSKYLFCILCAPLIPILIFSFTQDHSKTLYAATMVLFAIPSINKIAREESKENLEKTLCATNKILIAYCLIFSAGWII